jgi:hypothetical protein
MASILKSKALSNINKGNTSAYYSYVEEKNGTNPVLQQLEKELSDYMGFVKKKQSENLKPGEHAACKVYVLIFSVSFIILFNLDLTHYLIFGINLNQE